jgi:hypothetical protein
LKREVSNLGAVASSPPVLCLPRKN